MNDKIVMPVWTIGLFIVVMNTTMFNVSIPSIIQDLGITADLGSWVISSYSIGYALSTVNLSKDALFVQIDSDALAGDVIMDCKNVIYRTGRDDRRSENDSSSLWIDSNETIIYKI